MTHPERQLGVAHVAVGLGKVLLVVGPFVPHECNRLMHTRPHAPGAGQEDVLGPVETKAKYGRVEQHALHQTPRELRSC